MLDWSARRKQILYQGYRQQSDQNQESDSDEEQCINYENLKKMIIIGECFLGNQEEKESAGDPA